MLPNISISDSRNSLSAVVLMVLLWLPGDECPWLGYLDGAEWRSAEGIPVPMTSGMFWASMPTGPAPAKPVEARHEEPQP